MLGVGTAGPVGPLTTSDGETTDAAAGSRGTARTPTGALPGERNAWIVLATVRGVGPLHFARLVDAFGSARDVLEIALRPGSTAALRAACTTDDRITLRPEAAASIVAAARDPATVLRSLERAGVAALTPYDADYPVRLRAIELPPHVLFLRGDPATLSADHAVAVVGTRRPTDGGRQVASRIGVALARAGACVVSGLAVGIDGAAHAAVVHEGGLTVAVLGSGHARLFPKSHAALAERILATGGVVVSELAPFDSPTRGTFPRRNRLISGLADATVVVEAGVGSGALITAGWSLEQGRDCFIVPGPIDEPRSAGCLEFLRDNVGQARVVAGVPQLVADLGLLRDRDVAGARPNGSVEAELIELGATARAIGRTLVTGSATVDQLAAATSLPVATILGALTLLELRGLAVNHYGRYRADGRLAGAAPVGGRP